MGRSDINPVFDHMALKLKELGLDEKIRTEILVTLIELLQDQDWDTEDESLYDGQGDGAVVEAMRRCGITLEPDEPDEEPPHKDPADEGEAVVS